MIIGKDIIQEGHNTLKQIAKEVQFPLNDENLKLANDLVECLKNSVDEEKAAKYNLRPGVGIAAPQVNKSVRMFAIHLPSISEEDEEFTKLFINPKIVSHSEKMCYLSGGEGCLSVDDSISGKVPRYFKISIEAYDINGNKFTMRLKKFIAIVFQHEYDHLNGILFNEKITDNVSELIEI